MAKSVLDALVSVYVYLRNRLCLHNKNVVPVEKMAMPVGEDQRQAENRRLKEYQKAKADSQQDQLKLDHLQWIIDHFGIEPQKRAQRSIKSYELEAIGETQKAFVKATNKKADRCNLS